MITVAGMRLYADHKSEMVSQLLFGETFSLIESRDDWLYIEAGFDSYRGWVHQSQAELLDEKAAARLNRLESMISVSEGEVIIEGGVIKVSPGSTLYSENGTDSEFELNGCIYRYNGRSIKTIQQISEDIEPLALLFLNSPYLWGGRSCFGTDCSGFVQTVYKMAGVILPRDASVQATRGRDIHLLEEAAPGDLVFFDNDQGEITHTGILLGPSEVIHSYGVVRVDSLDHQGIFNRDKNKYTHKLRLIKRVL